MVDVSILISTYNRKHLLPDAIRSCLQENIRAEILVVDDGSTDNTRNALRHLSIPVRYFQQEHKGQASACNLGLHFAEGRYLKILDSDDVLHPGSLSQEIQMLDSAAADVSYGKWRFCNAEVQPFGEIQGSPTEDFPNFLMTGWWYPNFAYLFRMEFLKKNCCQWDEECTHLADLSFILKVNEAHPSFVHTPSLTGYYRRHTLDNTLSGTDEFAREAMRVKILQKTRRSNTLTPLQDSLLSQKCAVLAQIFPQHTKKTTVLRKLWSRQ